MIIKNRKLNREIRIKAKIQGSKARPRLSVFRSNRYIYAQLIDDRLQKTLCAVYEEKITDKQTDKVTRAKNLGMRLARVAIAQKITEVVFDKGSYRYHGRVKALADGAREGGLKF